MNKEVLLEEMKKLWKDTFHDSDAYIDLVFRNYYDPDLSEYHLEDGKLVAGLLSVPYIFGTEKNKLKGLYLCGLSTRPEFRRKGIMHSLFLKIRKVAKEKGFDFIFLIPADSGLRRYYRDMGMTESFYHVRNRYTSAHDFERDFNKYLQKEDHRVSALKKHYWNSLKYRVYDPNENITQDIINFIYTLQQKENPFGLLHSEKDMRVVINENSISGGAIFLTQKSNGELTGVAFITRSNDNRIKVNKLYASDRVSYYKLLKSVKDEYSEMSMEVCELPEDLKRKSLWVENYSTVMPESPVSGAVGEVLRTYDSYQAAEPGGMIEFLNVREILIFLTNVRKDSKFSILVKDEDSGKIFQYRSEKGNLFSEALSREQISQMKMPLIMTEKNLAEILCRKPDKDQFMMDAFGLPRLSLNMSLLLE